MADPAKRRATYADLLEAPEHFVAEILHGSLVTHPRPASAHARAASRLGVRLGGPFDLGEGGPGGWVILDEPELHLHDHVVVPDMAGWRRERMRELPDVAWFEMAPDWVCEILSPSTSAIDRTEKMPIYAQFSVQYVWLIDPVAHVLEPYRLDGHAYAASQTCRGDATARVEPFDAISIDLASLWAK